MVLNLCLRIPQVVLSLYLRIPRSGIEFILGYTMNRTILEAKNLTCGYDTKIVLRDINFKVESKEFEYDCKQQRRFTCEFGQ